MSTRREPSEYFDEGETVPPQTLVDKRWQAIDILVEHAYGQLPFYCAFWQAQGFAPKGPMDAVAFQNVPITRKHDLVRAAMDARSMMIGTEALLGRAPSNVVMTSGTMGFNSFAIVTDYDLDGASTLAQARELWMIKVRAGMRVLSLSPAWHALGLQESRAITRIGAVPVLPWGTLTPRFVGDILNAVTLLKPEHLLITARAVRMLLAECDRLRLDPRRAFASVRYLGCAGEALSSAFRAHLIRRLELDDVFERGGSSDGMFGGGECHAHRGHHISADVHYIEIVDPRTGATLGAGQRGTAVVTNLTLGKSVYIRFDTEDVAEVISGDCPCGRTHPVVEFYGRLADSVVLPDRIITPADVRGVLDEFESTQFRSFSMAWNEADGLLVRVGGVAEAGPAERSKLEAACAARLSIPVSVLAGEVEHAGWKEERIKRDTVR
jgi:phenylacetate-CoA ligase